MSRAGSPLEERMIFAFGSRRSGTFWLQRIITAHPLVADVPSESELFSLGMRPLFERFHHGLRSSPAVGAMWVDREVLLDAARDFCDRVLEPHLTPGARYLSERTPAHSEAVDLITQVYPDSRLIHIIRDGRDVARSLAARDWGPDNIRSAAAMWRDAVVAARRHAPAEGYLEVRYEDLLADPRAGALGIYEWLGLPIDDDVMERAEAAALRALNHDPKDPRLTTNKWRDHFSEQDLADFGSEAGDLLAELGYDTEPGPRPAVQPPSSDPQPAPPRGRRLLRRRREEPAEAAAPGPTLGHALSVAQSIADRLLTHLHAGEQDAVRGLLSETVELRVVSGDSERSVIGADAVAAALCADEAWRGPQLRGEQHPGVPTYSLVLAYDVPGVGPSWRLLQTTVRAERIQSVTLYALAGAPAPARA